MGSFTDFCPNPMDKLCWRNMYSAKLMLCDSCKCNYASEHWLVAAKKQQGPCSDALGTPASAGKTELEADLMGGMRRR